MPFVHVRVSGQDVSTAQIRALQIGATRLMTTVLRKKAKLTAVLVEKAQTGTWSVGGEPVSVAAHLDAKVTAGTNTQAEKAAFVAQAHGLLVDVLGTRLPVATYVVVDEIAADAWGYDGRTQEARRTAADGMRELSQAGTGDAGLGSRTA